MPFGSEYGINSKLYPKYKSMRYYVENAGKPFLEILNENAAAKNFIDAVIEDSPETAENYLSRIFGSVDFDIMRSIFKDKKYKCLINADKRISRRIKSVIVSSKEKMKFIIHFYLIKEPDKFGIWKISKIVKENITLR